MAKASRRKTRRLASTSGGTTVPAQQSRSRRLWMRTLAAGAIVSAVGGSIAIFLDKVATAEKSAKSLLTSLGAIPSPDGMIVSIVPNFKGFSVLGTIAARVRAVYPFVRVNIDSFTLRGNRSYSSMQETIAVRIGLSRNSSDPDHFAVDAWSERVPIALKIQPGLTYQIPSFEALIPVDGLGSLMHNALVLEVEIKDPETRAFVFSHSQLGIFK